MVETRFLISATRLETAMLRGAVAALADMGWRPALREAERAFFRCAGLEGREERLDNALAAERERGGALASLPSRRSHLRRAIAAEILFRDDEVFYVITKPEGRAFWMPPADPAEEAQPEVEIGVISARPSGLGDRLQQFGEDLRNACAAAAGGGELPRLEWRKDLPHTPRLAALLAAESAGGPADFCPTRLGLVELEYGRKLASPLPRQILNDLVRAGFGREQDLAFLAKADPEMLREALDELKELGLVENEYLLECKQDRHPLLRAKSRRQLEAPELAELQCPVCRGSFAGEIVTTVYSASAAAKDVRAQSQWLRIWLTDRLTQWGVPLGSILWRRPEGGQEGDVLAEYLGQLWLFAVKDGDFTADDSYALNYRRVRCRANRVVLLTTGAIGHEARRLLDEALRDEQGAGGAERLVYVEGLGAAPRRIEEALAAAALAYARHRLGPIEEIAGHDLGGLLRLRFSAAAAASAPANHNPLASVPKLALPAGATA